MKIKIKTDPSWLALIDSESNILIVHHWDADGISSGAIMIQYLKKHISEKRDRISAGGDAKTCSPESF